jgi:hypothetical protein
VCWRSPAADPYSKCRDARVIEKETNSKRKHIHKCKNVHFVAGSFGTSLIARSPLHALRSFAALTRANGRLKRGRTLAKDA